MSMSEEKSIRILIADDHPVVREGLSAMFSNIPELELIGEAKDGVEAVEMTRTLKPDVILLDLVMPHKDGLAALRDIIAANPNARILILTSFAKDEQVFAAIKAGALGYLLKDSSPLDLLQAIRDVYHGEPSLHPVIARKLMSELSRPSDLPPSEEPLTERELAVLRLVAQGLSNQEIGLRLHISLSTVKTHASQIYSKLNVSNRTQAVARARSLGLLPFL